LNLFSPTRLLPPALFPPPVLFVGQPSSSPGHISSTLPQTTRNSRSRRPWCAPSTNCCAGSARLCRDGEHRDGGVVASRPGRRRKLHGRTQCRHQAIAQQAQAVKDPRRGILPQRLLSERHGEEGPGWCRSSRRTWPRTPSSPPCSRVSRRPTRSCNSRSSLRRQGDSVRGWFPLISPSSLAPSEGSSRPRRRGRGQHYPLRARGGAEASAQDVPDHMCGSFRWSCELRTPSSTAPRKEEVTVITHQDANSLARTESTISIHLMYCTKTGIISN
jgi:hypothetical protein